MARDYQNQPGVTNELIATIRRDPDTTVRNALNLAGMNFSPYLADTAIALTDGRNQGTLIPVLSGDKISRLFWSVSAVTATVTTIKVGLYSAESTPALLSASANSTTAMDAIGITSAALSTPYTVTADGFIYAVILSDSDTAGTVGGMAGYTGKATATAGTGWPVSLAITETGQTDLDATITPTLATGPMWWGWQ